MFARKGVFLSIPRAAALATVAAIALTAVEPTRAFAGATPSGKGVTASSGTSDATDISARRRYYRGGGGAAAAAAFAGIVGTGLAIAAAQNRRDYYDSYGYYGGSRPPARQLVVSRHSNRIHRFRLVDFFRLSVRALTRSPRVSFRFEE